LSVSHVVSRRRPAAWLVSLVLAAAMVPAAAAPVAAVDGQAFVTVANSYRSAAGLAPVGLHALIDRIAVERADQLAASRELAHDFEYVKRRMAELGICWQGFGEIAAWNMSPASTRIEKYGDQWYNSPVHRSIMLGDYTHAGGSWRTGSDGRHYAVMIFVKVCGATAPSPSGFWDVGQSAFKTEINWLASAGITNGCASHFFCPTDAVERDQMATFLTRTLGLPTSKADYFEDDATSSHEESINRIADRAITNGCAAGRYCPWADVTRGQMASFLVRAFAVPATTRDYFTDDEGMVHEDAINRLAAAGISGGCSTGRYCPNRPVTREQMAAFLYRATH
jgi:uncharacterized protein YkwD